MVPVRFVIPFLAFVGTLLHAQEKESCFNQGGIGPVCVHTEIKANTLSFYVRNVRNESNFKIRRAGWCVQTNGGCGSYFWITELAPGETVDLNKPLDTGRALADSS